MMLFYFVAGVSDHGQLEPLQITGKPTKIYSTKIQTFLRTACGRASEHAP
jgi:hypothetical protein